MNYNYYVYILTNIYRTVFYTGITNDLFRRIIEHKIKINEGFTNDYNVNRLVHYELFFNINDAITREKRSAIARSPNKNFSIFPHMIDPENDPILNASSINSEDYWFLKLNNMEQQKPEAESAEKTEGNGAKE